MIRLRQFAVALAAASIAVIVGASTSDASFIQGGSSSPSGACGGDTSGTYPNCTVAKINGATVPAAGSLTSNQVLQVNGASSVTYGLVTNSNLAAGAFGNVTGTGTLTSGATGTGFTLDLSNSTKSGTLPLANLTGGTAGQMLLENAGATAPAWVTSSQDVTYTSTGAATVASISGASPIAITPANLQWAASAATPLLSQAIQTSDSATNNFEIAPQRPFASATGTNVKGADVLVNLSTQSGAGTTETNEAAFRISRNKVSDMLIVRYQVQNGSQTEIFNPWANQHLVRMGSGNVEFNGNGQIQIEIGTTSALRLTSSILATNGQKIQGESNTAVAYLASSTQSVTGSSVALSAAQIATPVIPLNGALNASNTTITVPNTVGAFWHFDLTSVTFGGHSLIITTGSGTSATITSGSLLSGLFLLTCVIPASNVVSCGGA